MTSELHWTDLKGIYSHMKKGVEKKDSYSSDSLDEFFCEESSEKSETYSGKNYKLDMNNDKSQSASSSDNNSMHDNVSISSQYSFEIEETQELQTENITESIDIRISPHNSIMSFNCSNNIYSEFSLVANVEVKIPEMNDNLDNIAEHQNLHTNDELKNDELECKTNDNIPNIERLDFNANNNIDTNIGNNRVHCDAENQSTRNKKICDTYYTNKMGIIKCDKRASSSIEKKIAEEIKELKSREEDLRVMREKLAIEMTAKTAYHLKNSETIVISKSETAMSTADEKSMPKVTPEKQVKTLGGNAYVQACVFRRDFSSRKDHSKIIHKKSSHQETPVEREIRISIEREEELKRERERALKSKTEMDCFSLDLSAPETDGDSTLSICSDSSLDSVSKLTPFFLRPLSPEFNKSNEISVYSSSTGSLYSLESSLSQRERQSVGSQAVGGSSNGSVLSPSPDSGYFKSGYSSQAYAEKRNQNIDMERFILSKGKEIKFKGEVEHPNYYEIKPPQVKKGEEMTCKRFITAAWKIKKELKEMQEREEQFKKDRASLQQDMKNECNTARNELADHLINSTENKAETTEEVTYSDLLPDNRGKDKNVEKDSSTKHARRSSILIDEWEQRIQKSFVQS